MSRCWEVIWEVRLLVFSVLSSLTTAVECLSSTVKSTQDERYGERGLLFWHDFRFMDSRNISSHGTTHSRSEST